MHFYSGIMLNGNQYGGHDKCTYHNLSHKQDIYINYESSLHGIRTKSQWTNTHRAISKRTKSKEDKNPGGQNPRGTKAQGDNIQVRQKPRGTKAQGDTTPQGQTPMEDNIQADNIPGGQNPKICVFVLGACVYCRGFAGLKAWLEMWQKWHQKSLVVLVTKFKFGV